MANEENKLLLREAYAEYIAQSNKGPVITEEYILLEKIDTQQTQRLINQIKAFRGWLAGYGLESVEAMLSQAEVTLEKTLAGGGGFLAKLGNLVKGKTPEQNVSQALSTISTLYNALSTFFGKDLPVILQTKLFETASTNPGTALAELPEPFNKDTASKTFANALNQKTHTGLLAQLGLGQKLVQGLQPQKVAGDLMKVNWTTLQSMIQSVPKPVPPVVAPAPEPSQQQATTQPTGQPEQETQQGGTPEEQAQTQAKPAQGADGPAMIQKLVANKRINPKYKDQYVKALNLLQISGFKITPPA